MVVPPAPVQLITYVVVVESGPTFPDPLTAFAPVQLASPVLAAQPVALAEVQVKLLEPPDATVVGFATKVTVGAGVPDGGVVDTSTETALVLIPPLLLLQVSVYDPRMDSGPINCVPLVALVPAQAPPAVQLSALVTDHRSVVVKPRPSSTLSLVKEIVGLTMGAALLSL